MRPRASRVAELDEVAVGRLLLVPADAVGGAARAAFTIGERLVDAAIQVAGDAAQARDVGLDLVVQHLGAGLRSRAGGGQGLVDEGVETEVSAGHGDGQAHETTSQTRSAKSRSGSSTARTA
jgi:hypothetical protein